MGREEWKEIEKEREQERDREREIGKNIDYQRESQIKCRQKALREIAMTILKAKSTHYSFDRF